jgi:ATP-dependent DNA ligase
VISIRPNLNAEGHVTEPEPKGEKTPSFMGPMKALSVDTLSEGDWLFEIKHDGYRAVDV